MSLGWHVVHALEERRVLATAAAALRVVARTVLEAGGEALLCFRGSDNHLHSVLLADRVRAGAFARTVANTLWHRLRLPVPFEPARIRPIRDQAHLRNTFDYVLGNAEHHGAPHDPLFEASNLPDLLGLRECGAVTRATVRAALPRIARPDLLKLLGVDELAGRFAPEHLVEATCAAVLLGSLGGRRAEVVAARTAAVHVAAPHLAPGQVDALLGLSDRSGARMRALAPGPVSNPIATAIRLQMDLRARKNIVAMTAPFALRAAVP